MFGMGDYLMQPGPAGTSLRDGAPQGLNVGMMGQGPQLPGIAQALLAGRNAPPIASVGPEMAPEKKRAGGFKGFLQTGGLGLLPALLSGGGVGDFGGVGLGNLLRLIGK